MIRLNPKDAHLILVDIWDQAERGMSMRKFLKDDEARANTAYIKFNLLNIVAFEKFKQSDGSFNLDDSFADKLLKDYRDTVIKLEAEKEDYSQGNKKLVKEAFEIFLQATGKNRDFPEDNVINEGLDYIIDHTNKIIELLTVGSDAA